MYGYPTLYFFCFSGSVVILGDNNNEAWSKVAEATIEDKKEAEFKTPIKMRANRIDV